MTMTDAPKRKTPKDVTDFEREQLRFFLTRDDLTAVLAELNPSLAWLDELVKLKLIQADTQLAPWLERNFADPNAVRDVVANIHLFNAETAEILAFRFNRQTTLPPLLAKSWRLIIRHMKNIKRGVLQDEWFDIAARLKCGEQSSELLERLADVLKPKPRVRKRFSLHNDHDEEMSSQRPSDLMSIDFEVEDGVSEEEVLSAWPENVAAEVEEKLLRLLTNALSSAVEDAIDAEVESNRGFGTTDSDVPSVAKHGQNQYRSGFLPIVRVTAELWSRLAKKKAQLALALVQLWQASPLKLVRRLALFAAADRVVPADHVADLLLKLPLSEIFLTNSSVEVYRVLQARWHDLTPEKQSAIEALICKGPPLDSFNEGSEKNRYIDRCRFDLLGDLQRSGISLTAHAENVLKEIRTRYPKWELKPPEQAGFHIWQGGVSGIVGDPAKLDSVPDERLVAEAKKMAEMADFMEGDVWQALCQSNPAKALRGLEAEAAKNEWQGWAWRPFLWQANKILDPDSAALIAKLLLNYPQDKLGKISQATSWWLNESVKDLDDALLWSLWDRIEATAPRDIEEASDE